MKVHVRRGMMVQNIDLQGEENQLFSYSHGNSIPSMVQRHARLFYPFTQLQAQAWSSQWLLQGWDPWGMYVHLKANNERCAPRDVIMRTIENCVTTVHAHLILELILSLGAIRVLSLKALIRSHDASCKEVLLTRESAIHLYACISVAGPKYSSWFHQYDGQLVEQHAHRIHSYRPSSFLRSSGDCKNSPFSGGLSFWR